MRNHIEGIFADLDGVLGDWHGSACRLFNREELIDRWPAGVHRISSALGMSEDSVTSVIDAHPRFWADIEIYPWATRMMQWLESFAPVTILTSGSKPGKFRHALGGKSEWHLRHFPKTPMIVGYEKELIARRDRLLIDDDSGNVTRWRAAGGLALLFPQPWNECADRVTGRMQFIREGVELYSGARGGPLHL